MRAAFERALEQETYGTEYVTHYLERREARRELAL
jgi:hypothetical protein